MRDILSARYCILMVEGMVVAMVYCDGLAMVSWRVVSFRVRVVILSAVVVDAVGGAADQLLSLLKAQ